jgi:hypothetical protein
MIFNNLKLMMSLLFPIGPFSSLILSNRYTKKCTICFEFLKALCVYFVYFQLPASVQQMMLGNSVPWASTLLLPRNNSQAVSQLSYNGTLQPAPAGVLIATGGNGNGSIGVGGSNSGPGGGLYSTASIAAAAAPVVGYDTWIIPSASVYAPGTAKSLGLKTTMNGSLETILNEKHDNSEVFATPVASTVAAGVVAILNQSHNLQNKQIEESSLGMLHGNAPMSSIAESMQRFPKRSFIDTDGLVLDCFGGVFQDPSPSFAILSANGSSVPLQGGSFTNYSVSSSAVGGGPASSTRYQIFQPSSWTATLLVKVSHEKKPAIEEYYNLGIFETELEAQVIFEQVRLLFSFVAGSPFFSL